MEQDQHSNHTNVPPNHERYMRAESQLRLMNALTQLEILERRLKQILDAQKGKDADQNSSET